MHEGNSEEGTFPGDQTHGIGKIVFNHGGLKIGGSFAFAIGWIEAIPNIEIPGVFTLLTKSGLVFRLHGIA